MFQVYDDNKHSIVYRDLSSKDIADDLADALNNRAGCYIFFVHEGDDDSYYISRG